MYPTKYCYFNMGSMGHTFLLGRFAVLHAKSLKSSVCVALTAHLGLDEPHVRFTVATDGLRCPNEDRPTTLGSSLFF